MPCFDAANRSQASCVGRQLCSVLEPLAGSMLAYCMRQNESRLPRTWLRATVTHMGTGGLTTAPTQALLARQLVVAQKAPIVPAIGNRRRKRIGLIVARSARTVHRKWACLRRCEARRLWRHLFWLQDSKPPTFHATARRGVERFFQEQERFRRKGHPKLIGVTPTLRQMSCLVVR